MRLYLAAHMLVLAACGTYQERRVDPEFQPHVEQFLRMAQVAGVAVSLDGIKVTFADFAEDSARLAGHCNRKGRYPTVYINRATWGSKTRFQRDLILVHELGHCVLDREHTDQALRADSDIPLSLMHRDIFFKADLVAKEPSHYAWELFHPGDFSRYGRTTGFIWR